MVFSPHIFQLLPQDGSLSEFRLHLHEFPQFSLHPLELRCRIWRETWEQRNVNIRRTFSKIAQTQ